MSDYEARMDWLYEWDSDDPSAAKRPLLTELADQGVLRAGLLKDGRIGIEENCDGFYSAAFTPDEIRALAGELRALADEPRTPTGEK